MDAKKCYVLSVNAGERQVIIANTEKVYWVKDYIGRSSRLIEEDFLQELGNICGY